MITGDAAGTAVSIAKETPPKPSKQLSNQSDALEADAALQFFTPACQETAQSGCFKVYRNADETARRLCT